MFIRHWWNKLLKMRQEKRKRQEEIYKKCWKAMDKAKKREMEKFAKILVDEMERRLNGFTSS